MHAPKFGVSQNRNPAMKQKEARGNWRSQMQRYLLCSLPFFTFCSSADAETRLKVCAQANLRMPSPEEHANWLENNQRYGADVANAFRNKLSENNYLEYQLYFLDGYPGASGWFDITSLIGVSQASKVVSKAYSCGSDEYPLLILIGPRLTSIKNNVIYVSAKKGNYTVVSLKSKMKTNRAMPV
jgi:hypothetical protein